MAFDSQTFARKKIVVFHVKQRFAAKKKIFKVSGALTPPYQTESQSGMLASSIKLRGEQA